MCRSVGRIGCDLRVGARAVERELGELRVVVGVNQVMRDPGVLRFERQQAIEDRRRSLLASERLVGDRRVPEDRERVEDRRLVILGKRAATRAIDCS
jgi:hypothetical protein